MSDLVGRLREEIDLRWTSGVDTLLLGQAADELERLRTKHAALLSLLADARRGWIRGDVYSLSEAGARIDAALRGGDVNT